MKSFQYKKPYSESMVRFSNITTPIYLEHGRIKAEDCGIQFIDSNGDKTSIPCALISSLLIGPGTTITHEAIKLCAESESIISFVGVDAFKFYSFGHNSDSKNNSIIKQATCFANNKKRIDVAAKMFQYRYPDYDLSKLEKITIKSLMGAEGQLVRKTYKSLGEEYGVQWMGRKYDRDHFYVSDSINYAINISNHALYSYCLSCISKMGFSPALGFFHRGKNLSFVFDVADLYKQETSLRAAFQACSIKSNPDRKEILELLKVQIERNSINKKMPTFLTELFGLKEELKEEMEE